VSEQVRSIAQIEKQATQAHLRNDVQNPYPFYFEAHQVWQREMNQLHAEYRLSMAAA
jgi:hypothetical protein